MAGRKLKAAAAPTPGPWLVRGEAGNAASPSEAVLGIEPATEDQPGGWPCLIRQDRPVETGSCPLHLATTIPGLLPLNNRNAEIEVKRSAQIASDAAALLAAVL